jgi:tRNA(adenine34) deaminase
MTRLYVDANATEPMRPEAITAMAQAARVLGDWRLNSCTLVVTLEPCGMCAGAAIQARVGRVVFGASDPKRGALGGCLDLARHPSAHHHMQVIAGVAGEAASSQLGAWFRRRRRSRQDAGLASGVDVDQLGKRTNDQTPD